MFYNISLGVFPYSLSEDFARVMKVDRNRATVLLQTETARVRSMAEIESYKQMEVSKYQIIATLDDRTSDICQSMDMKIFDTKDYEVGVTAPPFHPNCRSTKVPYYEDNLVTEDGRIARDENGKQYTVGNLSYSEWAEKYVKNPEQLKGYGQYARYKKVLGDKAPNSFDKFVDMKYNNNNNNKKYADLKTRYYIKTKAKLTVNQGKQGKHILGHNNYQGGSYVFDTIDIQKLVNKYAGNGDLKISKNKWNNIEFIEYNENIGIFVNIDKTERYETKRFSIHYSKTGVHIVPRKGN
ncbi:polymorphic toxin type 50 domain-containing protein [Sneathia sanguinegens]|uniref:polymorphic toxin type 50 domain-containing protein n=1 Tax=Sneathia sanguinegens TaxID=40543 RepID=UPI0023F9AA28|nr:polymorphic toxin type 50 domain-containing protein [Sneathia sanguinegens]